MAENVEITINYKGDDYTVITNIDIANLLLNGKTTVIHFLFLCYKSLLLQTKMKPINILKQC